MWLCNLRQVTLMTGFYSIGQMWKIIKPLAYRWISGLFPVSWLSEWNCWSFCVCASWCCFSTAVSGSVIVALSVCQHSASLEGIALFSKWVAPVYLSTPEWLSIPVGPLVTRPHSIIMFSFWVCWMSDQYYCGLHWLSPIIDEIQLLRWFQDRHTDELTVHDYWEDG